MSNKKDTKEPKTPLDYSVLSKYRGELFGISIIFIMIFHYFHTVIANYWSGGKLYFISYAFCEIFGSIGVEVFMFLSGLGLYFSFTKNKDTGAFYRKRFVRILVPYIMFGSVMWLVTDIIMKQKTFAQYFYDLSLFPFWISGSTRLWFLSAILVFYIFFPLFYEVIASKHYKLNTFALISFLGISLFLAYQEKNKYFKINEIATTRLPIFILGIFFGRLVYEKAKIKPWHFAVFGSTLILKLLAVWLAYKKHLKTITPEEKILYKITNTGIYDRYMASIFSLGFMLVCILVLVLIRWKPLHKFLTLAGGISLELYMTHVSVNWIIRTDGTYKLWLPQVYLVSMAISVVLSIILHKLSTAAINKLTNKKEA